jgi:hypothetical protein
MATFVHIFPESEKASILKNGIKVLKTSWRNVNGVFLSPVTANYYYTHQWNREVLRLENVPRLAARVRISDDDIVYIGKYNERHQKVIASEAIKIVREHIALEGLEVILPRKVLPKEITKIYKPNRNVGWRYYPGSNGKKPCGCDYCQRGLPYSRKLQERYKQQLGE